MGWIQHLLKHEVLRFLLSGGSLFALDLCIFLICRKWFGIDVAIAEFMARATGASVGFVLHKFFTFANRGGDEGDVHADPRRGIRRNDGLQSLVFTILGISTRMGAPSL